MKRTILFTFFINICFTNILFANPITLNSNELQSGNVAQGVMSYYKITATNGNTVKTILNGLADDADLYVKIGTQPTTSSYDCRSIRTDTRAEDCSVTLLADSDVFIGVHGYKATAYQIKATIQGVNNNIPTLISGTAVPSSVTQGIIKYYKIAAKDGDTVKSLMNGLTDDADLYVKIGSKPTTSSYDCRSIRTNTRAEDCSVTLIADSDVFVGIHGYKATNYNIKATIQGGGNNNIPILTSGTAVTGSVNKGETKYYKIAGIKGKPLASLLNGLSADADLYVKIGSKPTNESFDCKSTNGGTNSDECAVNLTQNADVYVAIYGYKATNYSIKSTIGLDGGEVLPILTSGTALADSVTKGETKYYKIAAIQGQTVASLLSGLNDDSDLYVKIGSKPTGEIFDCKSTNGGINNDECSVTLTQNADVYIAVYGYKATNYTIKATKTGIAVVTPLISGTAVTDSIELGTKKYYKIEALQGQTVSSILDQLTANANIYIRVGAKPTDELFDCKSINLGTANDECSITLTEDADVYIAIDGVEAANYSVKATVTNPVPTLTSGQVVSSTVLRDQIKYYKINTLFGQTIKGIINQISIDADIYIRKGSKPTTSTYDCKSTKGGVAADSCSIVVLDDMEVYIGVFGFRDTEYSLKVTATSDPIPVNPTVLEDAEGATLNPNWIHVRGDQEAYIHPTPNIPGAPAGTGVMVHYANAQGDAKNRYTLPVSNTTQKVLSMDCGGLPTHLLNHWSENYRGYIPHHSVGVVVQTKLGERIMEWNSWYNHQGYDPVINDNGQNVFLQYPSPVEMVSGFYKPIDQWDHFEVNLETELKKLEPNNRIYKITQFFTTGGYLDNITLSSAP